MDLQTALSLVKNHGGDMNAYRDALEYLVDHRGELKSRVFIVLPGGLGGNSDPIWDKVKANTDERCSCGNERTILPLNLRTEYEAGTTVEIKPGQKVSLRSVGGDRESAYVQFSNEAEEKALTYILDPYAPFVLTPDIFSTKGWTLEDLAGVVGPTAILNLMKNKSKTPIARFAAVDLTTGVVTLELDKDIESFDGEAEKARHE